MVREIKVKDRHIGDSFPCYIIAEMSANHRGILEDALEIVREAKRCGADCIKIQTYTADTLTIDSDTQPFQIKEGNWKGESLYKLYQKAYTPWEWQADIKKEAEKVGLDFLSTPFDNTAVDFLEKLGVNFFKIASFEMVDIPLVKYTASKQKPIIMSTGMGTLGEIEEAVAAVRSEGNNQLCLLKCSSAYPAVLEDMNLRTIPNMKDTFNVPVGLSDHTLGSISAITGVALGANVIEKHFCLSRKIPTPDSSFSMEPKEFQRMVEDIRCTEKSLGNIKYKITSSEEKSLLFRRSIFVVQNIQAGEEFTEKNIRIIRPAHGLSPKYFSQILGKRASRDIERGAPLEWNMIK